MTYFDALASGRFKRVEHQWAFYPWGDSRGYLLPSRETYWRIHAWAAQTVKIWVLLTAAVWVLVGPVSIALVGVPVFAWLVTQRLAAAHPGVKIDGVRPLDDF